MALQNVVIDLSHHNTVASFHDVLADGVLGVIHKATQNVGSVDPTYDGRRARAESVNLLWGAYHFGGRGDPVAQADHFLGVVNPKGGELLVLDWEPDAVNGTMTRSQAEGFVARIKQVTGRVPVLYSGQAFLLSQMGSVKSSILGSCPLWVARYGPAEPKIPALWKSYAMWQYTDGANGLQPHQVQGVGSCDRDKYNDACGDLTTFWKM